MTDQLKGYIVTLTNLPFLPPPTEAPRYEMKVWKRQRRDGATSPKRVKVMQSGLVKVLAPRCDGLGMVEVLVDLASR